MSDEDIYRAVDGIREPDPTLGKRPKPAEVERPAVALSPPDQGGDTPARPRRKRVVLAQPRRTSSASMRARVELAEQTSWGKLLVHDLVKVQLRLGVSLFGLVVVLLGLLPLLFHHLPEVATWRVIGIPVSWMLLGIAPFPLLFGVGLWYNRQAERHERDFVAMIEN
ncbi:hypothetical protein [Saccharomonospora piscinae]|uniref:DUF485 domain-containing protein n=1 Tax=Saccharomonospora piscinae TaxID=687388 RepID=A0A1V9A180_SACPI|nr:hypothetical protein [Saccharomonospora piscinae]OQO90778.1 hypothetical protein B1813_14705 [Saccharomonospora piscinae]